MRRTTLQRTTGVALSAVVVLLTGCGTHTGGTGPGTGTGPGSGTASPSPTRTAGACTGEASLTAADTGRTLCLTVGGRLRLTLDGSKDRPWTPVTAHGGALRAINAGFVIQPGDAVAAFEAVAPGTARLTATRPLCAKRPGQTSCLGVQQWTVTVEVTKP
ncbi:hypothetical protein [Streptomyces sp. NPDC007264]|uniref:hypothetical protein n=1 Tax=Streptomyces sp. NPDC007264 TaxID=3364777 RepID=UPI0036DB7063